MPERCLEVLRACRIDAGTYSLHIEADGFKAVDRSGIELTESLNIGDFPMERID